MLVGVETLVPDGVVSIFTNHTEKVVVLVKFGINKVFTEPVVNVVLVAKPVGVTGLLAVQLYVGVIVAFPSQVGKLGAHPPPVQVPVHTAVKFTPPQHIIGLGFANKFKVSIPPVLGGLNTPGTVNDWVVVHGPILPKPNTNSRERM